MKVRAVALAAVALAAASSWSSAALAQGGAQPALPPVPNQARRVAPPEQVIKPATVLGEAWARAVRAVLDGVKRLVDAERLEAAETLSAKASPVDPCRGSACDTKPLQPVPPVRGAWLPASALREAVEKSPVQVGPVAVAPPTESPTDARGQHAVLLGAKMQLPWLVP
jgi:hypothetical protein